MIARVLAPALLVLGFLGAWEAYAGLADVDDFILPAPTEVGRALVDDRALLWDNLLVTAQEVGLGILVALVLGAGLAVALHFSGALRRGVYPLLVASQAVPVVVIAPLLVVWFGFGILPKLVDHRARLLLPDRRHDARRAGQASIPTSSSCCARSTRRAGRRSAGPRRPRRCPPR